MKLKGRERLCRLIVAVKRGEAGREQSHGWAFSPSEGAEVAGQNLVVYLCQDVHEPGAQV